MPLFFLPYMAKKLYFVTVNDRSEGGIIDESGGERLKIFDKLRKVFNSGGEVKEFDLNNPALWNIAGSGNEFSNATYFTCLKTLSEAVAKLPLKLKQQTGKGIINATDNKLFNVLKVRPNKSMTPTTFWAAVVTLMYHYGNAFVYPCYTNGHENPPELLILDPSHMVIYDDNAKKIDRNGGLWYVYSEPVSGKQYKFRYDEMLHFKTTVSLNGLTGLSVREILGVMIDSEQKSQKFINDMYDSGLTGKVAVEYTADLNEKLAKQAVKTFDAAIDASKAITFIPIPYGMKLNPLNIKLTDAQFLELKKYTSLQIAAAFGIKPNQLNDYDKASYANSEQQQQAFLTDTLLVVLKGFEEELTSKLLTAKEIADGYYFKFNVDVVLRADFATRTAGYAALRQNGFISANDYREREDMPFIPEEEGGNAYLVNGNMIPMNMPQEVYSETLRTGKGSDGTGGEKREEN